MNLKTAALLLGVTTMTTGAALAQEDDHRAIPHLDHVYVIMMENHHISQILGNPNAPFITSYTSKANLANNYFAVGHPSLTNYLETVGGSNFGIVNDNPPVFAQNTTAISYQRSALASLRDNASQMWAAG